MSSFFWTLEYLNARRGREAGAFFLLYCRLICGWTGVFMWKRDTRRRTWDSFYCPHCLYFRSSLLHALNHLKHLRGFVVAWEYPSLTTCNISFGKVHELHSSTTAVRFFVLASYMHVSSTAGYYQSPLDTISVLCSLWHHHL
ncbi:hypothetical protein BYT27DRAFT_7187235 [Phlegmacium glaucopus]|nr:hypothetical protein BYT27DRAFT_7187235 [Phlegmacium glaucopus]